MSINDQVYEEIEQAEKPLNRHEVATRLNLPLAAVSSAMHYLSGKSKIMVAKGERSGAQNQRFIVPMRQLVAPRSMSVLSAPPYVPPKVMHRPEIHAPGIVVRRYLTGEVLA